ncbi:RDD family protein [Rubripirellula lacrimiformis]|uniref:RDD family protein n=1 Tax=Rubripirellula lacrimiformis TaxID=1930273 RepID=A0A517N741_9BACT|nr:RDD family protein [Rubripirellula lacrimiformis]QDT02945.1 RDD family protein [Rubripirellula lacrimiformis]
MAASYALDTTIAVVTPENIAFNYQLAGPFRRLPAYLIDVAVRWILIFGLVIGIYLIGGLIDFALLGPFAIAAGFLVYFGISWFYGTLMETYYNGRTVGKWALGIRAIDVDGRPISGKRAFLRNLLRIADLAPIAAVSTFSETVPPAFIIPTGMVGLATMLVTRRMQRLGDLAAGTMVIVDERSWRLPIAKVGDPRVPALASFFPGDYRVSRSMARTLAVYAERRHYLTSARRREVARHLTNPLIERFDFRSDIDPDLLMYALYYKTFLADSSAELPDLGPLAGYSPLRRDANKPVPHFDGIPTAEVVTDTGASQPMTEAVLPSGGSLPSSTAAPSTAAPPSPESPSPESTSQSPAPGNASESS